MTIEANGAIRVEGGSPGGRASSAPLIGRDTEPTLFELSSPGRKAWQLRSSGIPEMAIEELVPEPHRRESPVTLAEVSERDLVGHFTRLSHRQYSVDLGRLPARIVHDEVQPEVLRRRRSTARVVRRPSRLPPIVAPRAGSSLLVELEEALCEITGMAAATLQPAAGAAGELTGLLLMRAWHAAQKRPAEQGGDPGLGARDQPCVGLTWAVSRSSRCPRTIAASSISTSSDPSSTRTLRASCSRTRTPWDCSKNRSPR